MRRVIVLFLAFFTITSFKAIAEETTVIVEHSNLQETVISVELGTWSIFEGELLFKDGTPLLQEGAPNLLKLTKSIIIPDQARMKIEVVSSSFQEYHNVDILPSKGNLYRNIDPATVALKHGEVYQKDAFFPGEVAELRTPHIVRDFRGQTAVIYPFQYNPVQKTLRVYENIQLKISVKDTYGVNTLSRNTFPNTITKDFEWIYEKHFVNYSLMKSAMMYNPVSEQGDMLIIYHQDFWNALQPFIKWKKLKGIHVTTEDVSNIGGANAIKTFVENEFNTNSNLAYVLLVGDHAYVPSSSTSAGDSDNNYAYIVGGDHYPDLFMGRFSAETEDEAKTMIYRTIQYEKYPDAADDWAKVGVGIGSEDGTSSTDPNNPPTGMGDDGEADWHHNMNIKADLLGFTYTDVFEFYEGGTYPGSIDAAGNPSSMDLSNVLNSGAGVINYTGHGSDYSFATTGFDISNINNLTNDGMWPFIWSVACVNGNFTSQTCFAEAWLRANMGTFDRPTGSVAAMMSTINQSWNPPMSAQDEFNDILIESYSTNIKRSFGGLSFNGCMLMNDEYGGQGDEMTDTWTLFGDPSVIVRTDNPAPMTVTHANTLMMGATSLDVNCNEDDALVSLTVNGEIIGTGYINGGQVTVNFSALTSLDTVYVTVTDFNNMPYLGYALTIVPTGPWVVQDSYVVNDAAANNNQQADYGETVSLDVVLANVGVAPANAVSAILSTADPNVTILTNSYSFGTISNGGVSTGTAAFSLSVNNNITDLHDVDFTIDITDNAGNVWNGQFTMPLHAPVFNNASCNVDDSASGDDNGVLDDSENADLVIKTPNLGTGPAANTTATLTTSCPYVTINTPSVNVGTIPALDDVDVVFNVTVDPAVPIGTIATFDYTVTAGPYVLNQSFDLEINLMLEDFETNDFMLFAWQMLGDEPWFTTTYLPFEGDYCSQSGDVSNNQNSVLEIQVDVLYNDSVAFFRKVSSEPWYDYLRFYIDGNQQGQWSGLEDWTKESFAVNPGVHTFKWAYEKDALVAENDDCAWLDEIKLPTGNVLGVATGVEEESSFVRIYPNPFVNNLFIQNNGEAIVKLQNALGQIIFEKEIYNNEVVYLDNNLPAGMYLIEVTKDHKSEVHKLIKQ